MATIDITTAPSVTLETQPATRREAAALEIAQHEVGSMIMHRMKRLLVVCDMHGDDLRAILTPTSQKRVNLNDGRAVMRQALLTEMNQLAFDIEKRLEQTWPSKL